MKIAIEALGIDRYGGGRSATITLLQSLLSMDSKNEYLAILSAPEPCLSAAGNLRQWIIPIQNRFTARLWLQAALPFALRHFNLVHFAKNLTVWGLTMPTVVTIHDLTPMIFPYLFPRSDVLYWRYIQRRALRKVTRIITVSQDAAKDLMRFYNIPQERIKVIHNACAPHFHPANQEEIRRVRERYNLPETYILHVGRIDRKKNITTLVKALSLLRNKISFDGKLVLIGEEYVKSPDEQLVPTIKSLGLEKDVIMLQRLPDADLPAVYSGALIAAFPSHHEGFGLVALEAMACGTPLVTNRAGAVGEVVGDAAVTLETATPENLTESLARIIQSPDTRAELRQKGLARATLFSWEKIAKQTLDLYQSIASQ